MMNYVTPLTSVVLSCYILWSAFLPSVPSLFSQRNGPKLVHWVVTAYYSGFGTGAPNVSPNTV